MAKSKNHTAHNQNKKAHRNGIHKPKRQRYQSLKGVDPKFIRNMRRSIKGTIAARAKKWASINKHYNRLKISPQWWRDSLCIPSSICKLSYLLIDPRSNGKSIGHQLSQHSQSLMRMAFDLCGLHMKSGPCLSISSLERIICGKKWEMILLWNDYCNFLLAQIICLKL